MRIDVTVLSGVSAGDIFHFDLAEGGGCVIGRTAECDLVLQDPAVSRKHARIEFRGGEFYLVDCGSTHGTVLMGFRLGAEEPRRLASGDEFKIGEAIFRASYQREDIAPPRPQAGAAHAALSDLSRAAAQTPKRRLIIAALLLVILGAVLFPWRRAKTTPAQLGHVVLTMPQERVIGSLSVGSAPTESDRSHAQRAQFALLPSDLLIEFEYMSEAAEERGIVEVFVDQSAIALLPPSPSVWQRYFFVYRDPLLGAERRLIFENTSFKSLESFRRWGVRNVRARPLTRDVNARFDAQLDAAIALVDNVGRTADALAVLLQAVQLTVLEGLRDGSLDAVGAPIVLDAPKKEGDELLSVLAGVRAERKVASAGGLRRQLEQLIGVAADIDAELWRRYNMYLREVDVAVRNKQAIAAHDALRRVLSSFPYEDDLRWVTADRKLHDKKIVPARVLANPDAYRRR